MGSVALPTFSESRVGKQGSSRGKCAYTDLGHLIGTPGTPEEARGGAGSLSLVVNVLTARVDPCATGFQLGQDLGAAQMAQVVGFLRHHPTPTPGRPALCPCIGS